MSRRKVQSVHKTMTAGDRFGSFHACQEISMVLPRRILRYADVFSLPRWVYAALILSTLFRQNILDLPATCARARMASATSRNMFDGRFGITF